MDKNDEPHPIFDPFYFLSMTFLDRFLLDDFVDVGIHHIMPKRRKEGHQDTVEKRKRETRHLLR